MVRLELKELGDVFEIKPNNDQLKSQEIYYNSIKQ